jgi:hypothetical protein
MKKIMALQHILQNDSIGTNLWPAAVILSVTISIVNKSGNIRITYHGGAFLQPLL